MVLGPRTFILIHDNLEAEVVWVYLLAKLHLATTSGPGAVVPQGAGIGLRDAVRLFWLGHYHASPFFKGGILLAVVVVLTRLAGWSRRQLSRRVGVGLAAIAGLCLVAGVAPQLSLRLQNRLPLLHAFTLSRFYFLLALPWVLLLVLAVRQLPAGRLVYVLVGMQLLPALAANPEFTNNLLALVSHPRPDAPGYAAFVAPGPLRQVQTSITARTRQLPGAYRVACLGLPPAVAQYNGFYTLDSYQTLYPLAYKQAFRPIIAGELAKSPGLATYFDAWGNRCYVLGRNFLVGKQPARTVQHLAFDAAAFRRLGGRYLLSAVRLAYPEECGLRLLSVFNDSQAYWQLHVYEAAEPAAPSPR